MTGKDGKIPRDVFAAPKKLKFNIEQVLSVQNLYPMPSNSRLRFCSIWKLRGSKKAKGIWVSDRNVELSLKRLAQKFMNRQFFEIVWPLTLKKANNLTLLSKLDWVGLFSFWWRLWWPSNAMLEVGPVRETAKLPRNVGHVGWVSFGSSERDGFQEIGTFLGER